MVIGTTAQHKTCVVLQRPGSSLSTVLASTMIVFMTAVWHPYQYEMLHKMPSGPVMLPLVPCRLSRTSTGTRPTMDSEVTQATTAIALTNKGTPGAA